MSGVEKYLLKNCSTQEAFSFSLCCEECSAIWKSKSIRFSRARVTPLSEGKRVIFDVLYKKEKEEARIRATAEAGMVFNKCPICSRLVCDRCFLVCDELDMCVSCAHYLQEQERNDKIYEKILKGQKKSEMFGATSAWYLYCYAGCGLMYFKTERGGFVGLGADKIYNIYRYADLATYEEIDGNSSIDKRMENGKPYIHLVFNGDYAARDVYMPSKEGMYKKLSNYFDECFGLGGKGFSGFKKAMQKNKQDVMAVAAMTQGIKSMMNGGDQAQAAETITSSAQLIMQGDRTEWIQKTEAALSGAGIKW